LNNLSSKTRNFVKVNSFSILFFLIISTCLSFFIYIDFLQFPLLSKRNFLLAIIITGCLTILFELAYIKIFRPILLKLDKNTVLRIVIISFLISLGFLSILSIRTTPFYFLYPKHDISIQASLDEGEKNSGGIYLTYIRNEYRDISFSELNIEGQYEIRDNGIYIFPGQTVEIRWKGIVGNRLSISFIPPAVNQSVDINWGDNQIDSYLLDGSKTENTAHHYYRPPINEILADKIIVFPVIFVLVLCLGLGFYSPIPYSSLLISFWLLVLLIFWPGIIGDTNIIATNEIFSGQISDWHPVIYTLLLGGLIKLSSTAASFLILQIIALGLIIGRGFSYLEQKGCNKKILWVLTIVFAFLPTNFLSIITLTNDIPYSITLLGLTIITIKIVFSHGKWLEKTINWVLYSLVSLTAILFRYNGIPAVSFSILCLLLFLPEQRKTLIKIIVMITICVVMINGPFFNLIGVNHVAEGQLDNILLHHLSAHVNAGTPLSKDQEAYLNSLYPLKEWEYSCCSNAAMWFKPDFNKELFHENSSLNRTIALDLFLKNPRIEIDHILCASDIVWNIPGKCEIKNPFIDKNDTNYYWTRSYFSEYAENSKIPVLLKPLAELILGIENNHLLSILFWRPAIYLYISIFSLLIFFIKVKNKNVFLILSPLLGQSLFLFFFNRIQNFRYQYCTVIIGLFLISLIFMPKTSVNNKNKTLQ